MKKSKWRKLDYVLILFGGLISVLYIFFGESLQFPILMTGWIIINILLTNNLEK